ncbi:hypothetical protein [Bradyrhizobium cenepequi]|uniref:hypothetical protein n=1 Tax=Bradyrhizobium cenepequi TaxID=2821403 RepID=UPI001CE2BD91|nr:hypothetical protein [Bradyrhizobium cenepequi]
MIEGSVFLHQDDDMLDILNGAGALVCWRGCGSCEGRGEQCRKRGLGKPAQDGAAIEQIGGPSKLDTWREATRRPPPVTTSKTELGADLE